MAAAAEAVRIIKDVVAFRKYRESDLIKNHAFVFSAEAAAQWLAPKECDRNDKRNAVRLLRLAIEEITNPPIRNVDGKQCIPTSAVERHRQHREELNRKN